jgi:hypothetical protein
VLRQKKLNREQQPRIKTPKALLAPSETEPMPAFLEDILKSMDTNPTAPAMGNSKSVWDYDHAISRKTLDEVAASDMFSWSALDTILMAIITGHPQNLELDSHRLSRAKDALLGKERKRGRSKIDDDRILVDLANAYAKTIIVDGMAEPEFNKILIGVIGEKNWKKLGDQEKLTLSKRIWVKFKEYKTKLLAESTASFHPSQQRRWAQAQQIIKLLSDLEILRTLKIKS